MKKRDNILRLKYRLELLPDGTIKFQVLAQDKRITESQKDPWNHHKIIGTFNEWQIISWHCAEIRFNEKKIFIRGTTKDKDLIVHESTGDQSTIDSIHKALEEMVKKVYGNCTVVKG